MKILVTGGSGFIGSALIRFLVNEKKISVINVDKLTYAANQDSLLSVKQSAYYKFEAADICDAKLIRAIFNSHRPDVVMHLAAESDASSLQFRHVYHKARTSPEHCKDAPFPLPEKLSKPCSRSYRYVLRRSSIR